MFINKIKKNTYKRVIKDENNKSNDELVVEAIRSYPHLYDHQDRNFNNNELKEESWNEIALMINMSVSDCHSAWNSLRKRFRAEKYRREEEIEKGSGTRRRAGFLLYEKMLFLENHVNKRKSSTTTISSSKRPKCMESVNNEIWLADNTYITDVSTQDEWRREENRTSRVCISLPGTTDTAKSNWTMESPTHSSQHTSPSIIAHKLQIKPFANFFTSFRVQDIQPTSTAVLSTTFEHIPSYISVSNAPVSLAPLISEESEASTSSGSILSAEASTHSTDALESALLSLAQTLRQRRESQSNSITTINSGASDIAFGLFVAAELERLPQSKKIQRKRAILSILQRPYKL